MFFNHGNKHFGAEARRGSKVMKILGMTFVGVILAAAFALVFGLVVKLLWNWLMPAIFGLETITYWQAFGIVLLAKLLFGGFGHHHRLNGEDRHLKLHFQKSGSRSGQGDRDRHGDYHEFWEKEGRAAFDDFVKRRFKPEPPE